MATQGTSMRTTMSRGPRHGWHLSMEQAPLSLATLQHTFIQMSLLPRDASSYPGSRSFPCIPVEGAGAWGS